MNTEYERDDEWYEVLRKKAVPDRLITALSKAPLVAEEVIGSPRQFSPTGGQSRSAFRKSHGDLTPALYEVLILLSDGYKPAEVALIREVSIQTVRSQIKWILAELGAKKIPQAVAVAMRKGIIH